MSAQAVEAGSATPGIGMELPERVRWMGEGVSAEDVNAELDRLHRAAGGPGRVLALARTLNLIVVPCSDRREKAVEHALDQLGAHTPSRTLVLREHGNDRVDASLVMECQAPDAAGQVGLCHDRILLTMDTQRLEHSASLLAPLLVTDLSTVIWLPEPGAAIPDPSLMERSQQILVDSASGHEAELRRLADLTATIRIHDLAWGRLQYWRAATAAAFDPPERRELLPAITAVEVGHETNGLSAALLLAGWIAARAGWQVGPMERRDDHVLAKTTRADGGEVEIKLAQTPHAVGCGGIEDLTFRAGSHEVLVGRGGATSSLRDLFAEALQPMASFARGYADAVGVAATMVEASG